MKAIFGQYKEFQLGKLLISVFSIIAVILTSAYLTGAGTNPLDLRSFLIEVGIFLIVLLTFYGMTTRIEGKNIIVSFGIGLIRKKIDLDKISQINIVRNPWYYGWGIRFIPNGMLYNVSGAGAVEIGFRDRRRVIRIGSQNPEHLKEEIIRRLPQGMSPE